MRGFALHTPTVTSTEEGELLLRLRAGEESACEALYRAYRDPLWRFAYGYVRSAAVAEELVQEVFLALWRNRADATPGSSLRPWLYAAIRNQALNHIRHERVVTRLAERAAVNRQENGSEGSGAERAVAMGAPAPDALSAIEADELDAAVARAVAALPERRRVAMTLRWKHDMSPTEIARVLGTTSAAVRVLLTRARQDLVSLLKLWRG